MSNLIDPGFVALHSQHCVQHADWLTISNLAKAENVDEHFNAWGFEDFLGLTVYLFVMTQSQDTREQLSQLLPKFGSAAVLPLLKILCKKEIFDEQNIPTLAQQSLSNMSPYPLVIGLNQVLDIKFHKGLKAVALHTLRQLLKSCKPTTQLVVSQLLSETNRQLVSEASAFESSVNVSGQHSLEVPMLERRIAHCV